MKINVDGDKYTFVLEQGYRVDVRRHGEPWVEDMPGSKAIHSMMCELDALRMVMAEIGEHANDPNASAMHQLKHRDDIISAYHLARRLVGSIGSPTEWSTKL